MIPLYGFLEGDTLGVVVLASPTDTIGEVAKSVQRSARVRVAPRANLRLQYDGATLDPGQTVADAGLTALDRVDVRQEAGR